MKVYTGHARTLYEKKKISKTLYYYYLQTYGPIYKNLKVTHEADNENSLFLCLKTKLAFLFKGSKN